MVAGPAGERVGEVRIAPHQVVESALTGPLPSVLRRARPDELPAAALGAGAALLRSLELPAAALERPEPG